MTDLLENLIECAAGKGIINKGLSVAQKSEFSWLMMLKRVCFFFFFPFCLRLVDIRAAEIDPRSEIPEGLVKVVYVSGNCLTTFLSFPFFGFFFLIFSFHVFIKQSDNCSLG